MEVCSADPIEEAWLPHFLDVWSRLKMLKVIRSYAYVDERGGRLDHLSAAVVAVEGALAVVAVVAAAVEVDGIGSTVAESNHRILVVAEEPFLAAPRDSCVGYRSVTRSHPLLILAVVRYLACGCYSV